MEADAQRARGLLRGCRSGALATATTTGTDTQPGVALVTPACTGGLDVLLLLSELSAHTRALRANAHCALLCAGTPPVGAGLVNPQTLPRLSLACHAAVDDGALPRARFLAVHPYAALYAGFADFHLWRLRIFHAHWVGGFAQAWTLDGGALRPPADLAAAVEASAARVMAHCNTEHAEAMGWLGRAFGGVAGAWRLVGVDADGCDLLCEAAWARAAWPAPLLDDADLRAAIVALAEHARHICTKPTQ